MTKHGRSKQEYILTLDTDFNFSITFKKGCYKMFNQRISSLVFIIISLKTSLHDFTR